MAQSNNMQGVAETFDVFGNKVGGTSIRVYHQPGSASSFSLGGNYYGEDDQQNRNRARQPAGGVAAAVGSGAPFGTSPDDEEEEKNQAAAGRGANSASAATASAVPSNNMQGVAETFDAFGNKVSGTSVRVRAPPGGASSITF